MADCFAIRGNESLVSFYKLHYRDPFFFNDGFKFQWRNGDITESVLFQNKDSSIENEDSSIEKIIPLKNDEICSPKTGEKCIMMEGKVRILRNDMMTFRLQYDV